ncbi:membrane protein insertion efficiency factor YidD [Moraxella lincolnii]|uniref:Putative membrane protein insertion efficiency factor n=1 Tax=Lwoffella lincolnii TaxID=90241 RepID=A0A1T0CJL5_9GAMM|nr:membrane protein insertion efficiency factor YidD [Moraxella lincolnii]OOS22558.1 membrane protein insertion efficiency factor YidD [Moraxella lincolnii]
MSLAQNILLTLIHFYQRIVSPILPARCRYYPTCSQYGMQAIQWHGAVCGGWLTIKRISRCHPLAGSGVDFVPLPLRRFKFYPVKFLHSTDKFKGVYLENYHYSAMLNHWLSGRFD